MLNKVQIIGHLGTDPDIRHTSGGSQVTTLSVATSEKWRDKQTGEMEERTERHRVVAFGKLAEIMGEYLRKGSLVFIEGRLQTRKWEDKEGVTRYTTEIIASELKTLSKNGDGSSRRDGGSGSGGSSKKGREPERQPDNDFIDDDIPF